MKHLVSRELHAYWERLRGERASPEHGDIDPAVIRSIIADTFLLDVVGGPSPEGHDFVVRHSGTRLNALFGADLRGRSLPSLWRTEDRFALRELLDLVMDDRTPVVAGSRATALDREPADLEMLLLPLRHHGGTHARVLGSIVSHRPTPLVGFRPAANLALTSFRCVTSLYGRGLPPVPPRRTEDPSGAVRHRRFTVYEGGRAHDRSADLRRSPIGFRQP